MDRELEVLRVTLRPFSCPGFSLEAMRLLRSFSTARFRRSLPAVMLLVINLDCLSSLSSSRVMSPSELLSSRSKIRLISCSNGQAMLKEPVCAGGRGRWRVRRSPLQM